MNNSFSLTGVSLLVYFISMLISRWGVIVPDETLLAAINGLVAFFSFVGIVWGQLRRKDVEFGIYKK
jgi:uncharacterized membrane protein